MLKTDPADFGGGRTGEPYTAAGLHRLLCSRAGCGRRAYATWQGCADDRTFRPLCPECDVDLNRLVLTWWGDPQADAKMAAYVRRIEAEVGDTLDLPWRDELLAAHPG